MTNDERIAQLRAEQTKLVADYRQAEAALYAIGQRLTEIDLSIRAAQSADSRALVAAAVEDRQRAAAAEEERVRAENAANHEAWLQLQRQGESGAARAERERFQQNRIDAERQREEREERHRRAKIDELARRGVTVYQ